MLDGFKDYLVLQEKSVNTVNGYCRNVKTYIEWFSQTYGLEFTRLHHENVLEYKSYLKNILQLDAKTINNKLSALVKFNEFLIHNGIQDNTAVTKQDFIKVQLNYASPAKIQKEDVKKFRQLILEHENKKYYTVISVLEMTALRISEALSLKISDVNLTARELRVRNGKGNKQRIVYINDQLADILKDYIKLYQPDSWLFPGRKGPLNRTVVNKVFAKYKDKTSDSLTPHQLRHHWCSNALENDFTVAEIASIAGHSNIHTTLLYTNPSKQKLKEKMNKL